MDYTIQVPSQLSSHIRALRKAKNLSQAELGARMGISQARIARIEGDPLSISVEQLLRLLSALGVRVTLETTSTIEATLPLLSVEAQGSVGSVTAGTTTETPKPTPEGGGW